METELLSRLETELEKFVVSARLTALTDFWFSEATVKTKQKLAIEIQERLVNGKNRKYVLQAITGLPILSQTALTAKYHSVLIKEIETNEASTDILREIERLILEGFKKDPFGFEPWTLFPWHRPVAEVSSIHATHLPSA